MSEDITIKEKSRYEIPKELNKEHVCRGVLND